MMDGRVACKRCEILFSKQYVKDGYCNGCWREKAVVAERRLARIHRLLSRAIRKFAEEAVKYGYFEGCFRCPAGYFEDHDGDSNCPAIKAGHGSESEHCIPALIEWFRNGGKWKEEP